MPALSVYEQIRSMLQTHIDPSVDARTRERLTLLVLGILKGRSASPARIARALASLDLLEAKAESIERRLRRIENDPQVTACLCLHPLARAYLALGRPRQLLLAVDPTTKADQVVMLTVSLCYRGRALPLCWAVWPANTPLEGERFWERVAALLETVASLLPQQSGLSVVVLADRAFGTPAFTDLVQQQGWHFLVRCQDQTRYCDARHCDARHRTGTIRSLAAHKGERRKLRAQVFKKRGWWQASVLAYFGRKHTGPLCLLSSLPPAWSLLALYARRFSLEAYFRDEKSAGWQWEQSQVCNLLHIERLLVGMALATWIALMLGTETAEATLLQPASGRRRTRPPESKYSLFTLGLQRFEWLIATQQPVQIPWLLDQWEAPNWSRHIQQHHIRAFVLNYNLPVRP